MDVESLLLQRTIESRRQLDLPWKWDFDTISAELIKVTYKNLQDVIDNPHVPWDWWALSNDPNITLEDVQRNPSLPWYWDRLTLRMPFADITANQNLPWTWHILHQNPSVSLRDAINLLQNVFQNEGEIPGYVMDELSEDPRLTLIDLLRNPTLNWKSHLLAQNTGVIDDAKHYDKDLYSFCKNFSDMNYIHSFLITTNLSNICFDHIKEFHNVLTCIKYDIEEIEYYAEDDKSLSEDDEDDEDDEDMDENIPSFEELRENIDQYKQDSNWGDLSEHLEMTIDDVLAHLEWPWDKDALGYNVHLLKPTETERVAFYKEVLAARKIWRAWFRAITNPQYALCRKHLVSDFDGLMQE